MTPTALRRPLAAALLLLAAATGARADGLAPAAGQSIDLGTLSGTAYYTVQPDGFHVVATLADARSGAPMRVEATLAAGQTVVLSTPGGRSGAPHTVEITRLDREVLVHTVALTN
jgi:hypothetical protein